MRILVYRVRERRRPGGTGRSPFPGARRGGDAQALVDDLAALGVHDIVTTADPRFPLRRTPRGVEVVPLRDGGRPSAPSFAGWTRLGSSLPRPAGCLERLAARAARTRRVPSGLEPRRHPARRRQGVARRGLWPSAVCPIPKRAWSSRRPARSAAARVLGLPGRDQARPRRRLRRRLADPAPGRRCRGLRAGAARRPRARVLVQRYVPGTAASVALVSDGQRARVLAVSGQALGPGSRFAYAGGTTPLAHPQAARAARRGPAHLPQPARTERLRRSRRRAHGTGGLRHRAQPSSHHLVPRRARGSPRERCRPRPRGLRRYPPRRAPPAATRVSFTAAGRVRRHDRRGCSGWDIGGANVKAALVERDRRAARSGAPLRPLAGAGAAPAGAGGGRRRARRRRADGRDDDRRARRLLRHQARRRRGRARRLRHRLPRARASGLRSGRPLPLRRGRAGPAAPRRRRQLDGERRCSWRTRTGRAPRRRRQHDHRHRSRSSPGASRHADAPTRRASARASSSTPAPCARPSARSCAPLPVRGRRCRVAAELFAIAADAHLWLGRIDASGLRLRDARRPGPHREPRRGLAWRGWSAPTPRPSAPTASPRSPSTCVRAQVRQIAAASPR